MTNATATETKKFEVDKTYSCLDMTFEVIKRTPCFVTYKHQSMFGNETTTRSKVYFDASENAEIFFISANMTVSANSELIEETEVDTAIEVQETIAEVTAEIEQLALNFDEDTKQFINDNQEDFETIRTGAKLLEMDACEGYVNKRFESISTAYDAAFNKIADAAALFRNADNRKAAMAITMYRNHIETLGRLQAHITDEQSTTNDTKEISPAAVDNKNFFATQFIYDNNTAEFISSTAEYKTVREAYAACLNFQNDIEDKSGVCVCEYAIEGEEFYYLNGEEVDFCTFDDAYDVFTAHEAINSVKKAAQVEVEAETKEAIEFLQEVIKIAENQFSDETKIFVKEHSTDLSAILQYADSLKKFDTWNNYAGTRECINVKVYVQAQRDLARIHKDCKVVKDIEPSQETDPAYDGENGLANKVACTLAYSSKLTPEQTTGALYGFIREAENAGLYDFARKVRFKVLQDCWNSTFDNFYIEDYLKLLKIK